MKYKFKVIQKATDSLYGIIERKTNNLVCEICKCKIDRVHGQAAINTYHFDVRPPLADFDFDTEENEWDFLLVEENTPACSEECAELWELAPIHI